MEKDYIKNAYDVISKDYNAGSFDDFKLSLAKPEGLKKVYDYLSQGYNVGDFDSFQKRLNDRNEGSIQVEQDPYIDDLGDRAMAGANRTLGSFANMIDRGAKNLEDWTDGVIKRGGWAGEAADAFNRRADEYIKESDRYGGKDFIQLFKEGDYTGAFGEIFLSATESLPQSLAIAATKTPGLIGAGIMTGNDKYDQLMDQKPGMNKALAIANASVTGLSETVTEIFGAGMLGKIVRNTLAKGGKAAAGNAIEKIIQDRVVKPIEKHWILGSIGSEGLEEMANAATEYAVDKLTGVERPDDIVETIMKAGVYGAAGGSQYIPVIGGAKYLASNRRKKITSRFNDSQSETSELLGADFDKFDDSLDRLSPEQQHDFIQQVGNVKGFNEEQHNSLLDYVVRKNQYTQYVDYVKSRISEEQQRARDEIDRVSNPDMGAVITVKSNLSENPANIVGGKIVFDEEGLVDIDNSDETIYYLDENGKRQMATPDKFASLIDNAPLSRLYANMMAEVQEKVLSDEESVSEDIETNNVVDPAVFDIGMDVLLPDGKQGMIQQFDEEGKAIVVTDGGAFSYPVDQLSKMGETSSQGEEIVPVVEDPIQPGFPLKKDGSPDYKAMNPQQRFEYTSAHDSQESAIEDLTLDISSKQKEIEKLNEKLSTSTGGDRLELRDRIRSLSGELTEMEGFYSTIAPVEVAPVNDEAAETTQPIVEPTQEMAPVIPTDESGEPIYHQAPIEVTLGELMDGTLEPDEVDAFVSAQRQMAEKSLNKAKNYQPKMGTSKAKYLSEKKSAQDKVNGAQAIVDYWNNVENSIKERRVKPGDEIANDIKAVGEPLNGDELAAMMLANGAIKLTRDSYKKETGFSDEDAKKMFGLFSSSGNEGVNLERAGELLMLADQENGTNFFDEEDANAGRNAILSVLSSSRTKGDLINYIKSNREAMAERERQAEYNAYTQWCEEMYRMSPEDYEAYEEQARDIAEKNLLGEEYDDFMSNLANEQDITGNENYQGNEQPGAGGVLEGVGDVLQGEGLVQAGRDGGVEEGSQEIDGSVDSEDGIVQEGPLGRITASEQDTPTSIAKDKNVILDAQDEGQKSFVAPKRNQNDNILDYAQRISDAKNLFDEEQNVNIDPSDAQKEAGNYKKGHVKLNGFDITIEQPAGSVRTGKDADGKEWSVTMNNTYGYIRGTEGVDGDHIDVFLGPDLNSDMVYVVDQVNPDSSFDEHKVMMGFGSVDDARSAYLANYEEGWQGLGNITGIPTDDFKKWIDSSKRKTKPFAEYNTAKDKSASDNNRLVTDERYEDLKRRMREKLGGQMNIGVDPEILAIGTEMAVYHIEKGAREFVDYAKGMINDLGDSIRPYLKAFYNGARDLPEMAKLSKEMDRYEDVSRFDVANLDKPVKDMLATIDTIAKEREAEKQVSEVEKKITTRTKRKDKSVYSQGNDLFNQNSNEHEIQRRDGRKAPSVRAKQLHGIVGQAEGNQDEDLPVGRQSRKEVDGRDTGGDAGGVHGSDGVDPEGSRGVPKLSGHQLNKANRNRNNYRFGENHIDVPSGEIAKLKANIEAVRVLKEIERDEQPATNEQKLLLSRYVGWGGLANALDENKYAARERSYSRDWNWNEKYLPYHERLRELLSPEEFRSAIQSTTTSHYTPETVVKGLWNIAGRLGFKGGEISEPAMGVGHIIGMMPKDISSSSNVSGFEIDDLSGRIGKALYPDTNVKVQGYETEFSPKSKDLVITNVPFGKDAPYDKVLDKTLRKKLGGAYNLHNYFIAKGLLELKEGGLGVFVTSSATMDGADSRFREFIQGNGFDLVGAIRLPNDTFQKNAGTSVTADVLMFQRRKAGEASNGVNFVSTTSVGEGSYKENGEIRNKPIMVNEYFSAHPEMMLGEMMTAYDAGSGGLYSGASQTLRARPGEALDTALDTAINQLPENILEKRVPVIDNGLKEQTDLKDGSLLVRNGKVYLSMGGALEPVETKDSFTFNGKAHKTADAIKAYNELKDTLKRLISAEQSVDVDPEPIRKDLNKRYDNFVQSYGTLNWNKYLDNVLAEDFEHNLPLSLENINRVPSPTGKSFVYQVNKGKGILDKRVSFPVTEPTKAGSIQDAANISRSYRGTIDIPFIAGLVGKTDVEVMDDLLREGVAYKDPVTGTLVGREEYLSGNVSEKLDQARAAAETSPDYEKNVEDLVNVQPEVVRFGDISYRLGTTWIPSGFLDKFAEDVLGVSDCGVRFVPVLNEFVLDKSGRISDYAKSGKYKTDYLGTISLFEAALNQRKPKVYDEQTVNDPHTGESRKVKVVNEVETQAAAEKISEMSDKFIEYIDGQKAIHKELERIYNDKYNNFRLREFDLPSFSYLGTNKDGEEEIITHYPNSNQGISLREHQAKAVQRGLAESTLLAHQVGTGKTFTMITTAMEMRRLGIARKPMIVVQNATLEDFVKDFYKLYPGANVLAPGKDERSSENRKRLFNLIATGDFDAIVIPQSFMQFIPDDEGRKKALIQRRIEEYEAVIESTEDNNLKRRLQKEVENLQDEFEGNTQGKKRSVKDKAKAENRIKSRMERQLDRRTDDVLTFEQMGIDALFIDEAHNFKKIGFASKMNNVKGIDTGASQRANSLLLKSKWVQEKNNGRNVILATGTPITNTMAEVWTMMNFVSPDILEAYDIKSFDEFATTFGMVEPSLEFTATGNFKIMDRFKSYVNVPELIKAFRSHADVVLTEDVKEFKKGNSIPKLRDDNMTNIVIDKNEDLQDVMQVLVDKLEKYNEMSGREKREMSALPLVVFTKAKQAAIDLRLLNPSFPDNPNSKTNQVVSNVARLYSESNQERGAQLIFCDSYQSPADRPQMDLFGYDPSIPRFNLYEDIKEKLISQGIPAKEIAIVNEYDGDRRKSLFEKVRNGDVRVLIGSTEKMGVGVNVQDRLYGLHHIDAPLRPMDFEQRNGRILRQGNNYALWDKPVNVLTYGVQGTLDATAYDRLRIKQDFINQMMKGDVSGRVMEEHGDEDPSGMTFQQMAATLSGDKTAQLLFVAENKLKKLRNLKRGDANSKSGMAETIEYARKRNMSLRDRKRSLEKMRDIINERFPDGVENVIANRSKITDKFSVALDPMINSYDEAYSLNRGTKPLKISLNDGKAEVIVHFDEGRMVYDLYVGNEHIVETRQFNGGKGLMSSIDHQLKAASNNLSDVNEDILGNERKIEGLTKAMNAPWGREEELKAAEQEVLGLKKQLEEKAKANDNKAEKVTSSLDIDGTIVPEGDVRFRSSGGKGDRIQKLRDSIPVELTGEEYKGKYELNRESSKEWMKNNLRGEYTNEDTGEVIEIRKDGIQKVTSHSMGSEAHLKSIVAIPDMIKKSVFIEEIPNTKDNGKYDSYRYYVYGLKIGGTDYTVKVTVGVKGASKYYDHALTQIEKGTLLNNIDALSTTFDIEESPLSGFKDTKLLSILQTEERKKAEIVSSIESLSENLNTSVNIIQDINDIADDSSGQQRKKRGSKGWYDPETREVFLVLPNAESIADAQATVLHEVVGHKGLRGLLGDRFNKMMDTVLRNLPEDTRREIIRESIREYNFDNRKATEEYLASIAEKGIKDPGTWNKIKSSIKEFFRSLGMDLRMTDEDIAYMLWRSKNRLQKGDNLVDIAKKIADDYNMRQDLLFRGAPSGVLLSENREGRAIMVDTLRNIHQKWDEGKPIVRKFYERFRESYQDSMLALKRFQEGVEGEILDFENAYLNQNTIISRSNYEIDHFKNDLIDPINEMMNSFGKSRDIETYLMIRHGLERNERMRAEAVEKKRLRLEREYQEEKMRLDDDLQNMIDSAKFSQKEVERKSKRNDKRLEELEKSNSEAVEKERVGQSLKDYSGLTDISKELLDRDFMDEKGLSAYAEEYEKTHPTGELWDLIRKANKASINKLFESGYISKEEAGRINGMYQYYIPLRGWDQTTAGDMYDYFFKDEKDTLNNPIKSAKGRKSRAGSVLANISAMYESAVFVGNKNKMKQRFLNLVRNHPSDKAVISGQWYQNTGTREDPEWIAVLPEGLSEDSERNAEILDEFEKKMADLKKEGKAKTAKEFLELGVPVKTWQADQHAIRVKEAGRDLIIYINGDPRVAQAINGLNNKTVDIRILRYVDGVKRFMMKNYTTRSINFIGRNLIRDMIYVNTMNYVKYGARYEMDFIKNILPCHKAIYRSLRGKAPRNTEERRMMDLYEEFKRNGGQTGFVALRGYDKYKKDLERAIKNSERGKYTIGNLFHTIGSFIEATNTLMEDTSRFSVYATSKQSGKSITQSISDAKEASVNFNRKGSGAMGAAFANSFYFFFNAGTQGTHNFLSASKNNKKRAAIAIGAWGAVGFAMSMLAYSLAMSGDDDDEYNMLPDFVRQNNLVLPILGTSKYILLPLPIELRTIFGAGDMLAQYMRGEYKGRSFSEDLVGKLLDILPHNFVGEGTDNVVQNMLPDASRPFVDAYWFNQNYFGKRVTGRNEYNEHKPEFHKVVSGTSKAITKASEKLNELTGGDYATKGWADGWLTNPSAIEYIFEQMTGGAGKAVTQAYKTVEGLFNNDVQLRNIPVASGLSYDMENAVPRNYINERYNGYMDLIEKENTRDKLYMRGLKEGGDLLDSFKEMRYSKDYMVANIAKMYKSQIEGMYSIAEEMTGEDKKAMFATIRDKKKQMLDEIDAIK